MADFKFCVKPEQTRVLLDWIQDFEERIRKTDFQANHFFLSYWPIELFSFHRFVLALKLYIEEFFDAYP
jgi:hypothetical protein